MTEPKRWIDEGPPEVIGRLLDAASAERPPEESMSRTLTALGLGIGATGAATTAGASTAGGALTAAAAAKTTSVLAGSALVKWGLLAGALTAAGVAGKVAMSRSVAKGGAPVVHVAEATPLASPRTDTSNPARTMGVAPSVVDEPSVATSASASTSAVPSISEHIAPLTSATPDPVAPSAGVTPESAAPAVAKAARKTAVRTLNEPKAPVDAQRLAEEVALVDQARDSLARGDARGTLKALDDYEARFPQRTFAPEALYLRMEALLRLGQATAARSVAARLATTYPSSPHTARARQVLASTIP